MFAGQLGCEAVNWGLKRLIKESRPARESCLWVGCLWVGLGRADLVKHIGMHGEGYGMPSSHAQFVAFFSIYIILWVFLRWVCFSRVLALGSYICH